jgi:hyperosmotically inducible periplasmic protein
MKEIAMKSSIGLRAAAMVVAALVGTLSLAPSRASAKARHEATGSPPTQNSVSSRDAEARLNKSQFNNVSVSVDEGVATLRGTVDLYQYKADAEKRALKAKGVKSVRNHIEVNGPKLTDQELQEKLVDRLAYDRVGFGNVFNAVSVRVDGGVVHLDGHARTYVDRASAVALVSTTPGVLDVVESIDVDPVSMMDDEIRIKVARAVYGDSALRKYAIDPAKPIRISVQDGNVSLYGSVDNRMDANIAYLRANGVSGVFKVSSYLQTPGETTEKLN